MNGIVTYLSADCHSSPLLETMFVKPYSQSWNHLKICFRGYVSYTYKGKDAKKTENFSVDRVKHLALSFVLAIPLVNTIAILILLNKDKQAIVAFRTSKEKQTPREETKKQSHQNNTGSATAKVIIAKPVATSTTSNITPRPTTTTRVASTDNASKSQTASTGPQPTEKPKKSLAERAKALATPKNAVAAVSLVTGMNVNSAISTMNYFRVAFQTACQGELRLSAEHFKLGIVGAFNTVISSLVPKDAREIDKLNRYAVEGQTSK